MRKMVWVFGVILLAAFTAAAQEIPQVDLGAAYARMHGGNAGSQVRVNTLDGSLLPSSKVLEANPGGAAISASGNLYPNMVIGGYKFIYVRIGGSGSNPTQTFLLHGFDVTYIRWLRSWFGVEGTFGGGWGSNTIAQGVDTRLLYGTGGIRIATHRDQGLTPYAHLSLGGGQVKFTSASGETTNTGLVMDAGVGLIVNFGDHWAIKLVEVNYFLTRFASANQNNIQAETGIVFKF